MHKPLTLKTMKYKKLKTTIVLGCLLTLGACSSSNNDVDITDNTNATDGNDSTDGTDTAGVTTYGYTFTRSPVDQSGEIVRISLTDGNTIDATYPGTLSDFTLATDGEALYQIGRFQVDTLTRLDALDTSLVEFDVSLIGEGDMSTNAQSMVFLSDDIAYLTQRSSDSLLIIDPTPEDPTAESVISGEISLAAYNRSINDATDLPDMTNAVLVDNKLFVLLENLDGFNPVNSGYIAVIDTTTNEEIDTGMGISPLQGIQLNTVNPTAMHYNAETDRIYVTGRGNAFHTFNDVPGDPYTGGIESINPETYETRLLVDDGTSDENQGFFTDALVVNDTLGYVLTLDGFNEDDSAINNLRTFNPMTGEISEPVLGTEGFSITTLTLAPDNHLWAGFQADMPGFLRIDTTTGLVAGERVITNLIPSNDFVFIDVENQ